MAKTAVEIYREKRAAELAELNKNKARDYRCYEGFYRCPKCKSERTASNTIATSSRWMDFICKDCGHAFRRSADRTSALSASLKNLANGVGKDTSDE